MDRLLQSKLKTLTKTMYQQEILFHVHENRAVYSAEKRNKYTHDSPERKTSRPRVRSLLFNLDYADFVGDI